MSIIRAPRPESNFYTLDKSISEDTRLSWAARGLLVFLLGKPDNWQVSVEHLRKQTSCTRVATGRDGVYALLREIEAAGYLRREMSRNESGQMAGYDYHVSEFSQPCGDQPCADEPSTVETTLTKTDLQQGLTLSNRASDDAPRSRFEEFWKAYPVKKGKAKAEAAWKRKKLDRTADKIIADVNARKVEDGQWLDGYIPHGSTYVCQERWTDDMSSIRQSKQVHGGWFGGTAPRPNAQPMHLPELTSDD